MKDEPRPAARVGLVRQGKARRRLALGFCSWRGAFSASETGSRPIKRPGSSSPSQSFISLRFSAPSGWIMALGSDDKVPSTLNDWERRYPTSQILDAEAKRRQRLRSIAIAWALAAIALMFFLVTIVRLGANVANRPL